MYGVPNLCRLLAVFVLATAGPSGSAGWNTNIQGNRHNFAVHGAARVAFDVVHQETCRDNPAEICAVITWSCYEATDIHGHLQDRRPGPRAPRWYFLDIEGDRDTLRFEMRKATTMTPTIRLTPYKNYTAKAFSMYQEHVVLLRNLTFATITGAPSRVQQLTVDVLDRNVAYLPRARKLNISWTPPQNPGARTLSGYVVGLYKKPDFSFGAIHYKNVTIMEAETNYTWHIVEPISFYERKMFIKVVPFNVLQNGSQAFGPEIVANVYLTSQYSRELSVNSVGSQSVDIEIDQDIFKDIIEAGLVTNISVFVSPVEMVDLFSWRATDFSKAVVEDKMKQKQIRAVFRVSPHNWNLGNAMDKRRQDYTRFPCFEGGDRRKVVCSIGVDERCEKLMYAQVCNAPLVKNMNYTVFVRAHLKKSNYLPEYDDSKPLPVSLHTVAEKWLSTEQLHQQKYPAHQLPGLHLLPGRGSTYGNSYDPRLGTYGRRDQYDVDSRYDSGRGHDSGIRSGTGVGASRFDGNNNPINSGNRFDPRFDPGLRGGSRTPYDQAGRDHTTLSGSAKGRFDVTNRYGSAGRRDPIQHIPEQP